MKCLEKDRARRYETANNLADDIERHLKLEPVNAAAPSALYRAGKFIHRHKTGLATATALVLLLVAGVVVSTWQAVRAIRAEREQSRLRQQAEANEKKAQAEANKSLEVIQFLNSMLNGAGQSLAQRRETTLPREILDQTADRIVKELKNQPDVEVRLLSTLGGIYRLLGEYEKAEAMHRQALAMGRKLLGEEHRDVASSLAILSWVLHDQGKPEEAEIICRQALAIQRRLLGEEHRDVAQSLGFLVLALHDEGKLAEAETACRQLLAMRRKMLGEEHPDVAWSLAILAWMLQDEGKLEEADSPCRQALAMRRKLLGEQHRDVAWSLDSLGWVLLNEGILGDSETAFRQALAMRRKLLGEEHRDVAMSLADLARVLRDEGKLAEAETVCRQALAMRRKLLGEEHREVARSLADLAGVLRAQGRLADVVALYRKGAERSDPEAMNEFAWLLATCEDPNIRDGSNAVRVAEKAVAATGRGNAQYLDTLAAAYAEAGRFADAVNAQQEAIALMQDEKWKKEFASRLRLYESHSAYTDPSPLAERTRDLLAAGGFAEAEAPARQCLALRERETPDDWRTFNARSMLGGSLLGQKKHAEAEPWLLSGYEGLKQRENQIPAAGRPCLKETLQRLVQLYDATGRADQAAEWKRKLAEFEKAETGKQVAEPPR